VLDDPSSATPAFTAPPVSEETTLRFQVTVSDGTLSATDTVDVVVGAVPAPEKVESGGCGCGAGAIDPSLAALFPLAFVFRRRRRQGSYSPR